MDDWQVLKLLSTKTWFKWPSPAGKSIVSYKVIGISTDRLFSRQFKCRSSNQSGIFGNIEPNIAFIIVCIKFLLKSKFPCGENFPKCWIDILWRWGGFCIGWYLPSQLILGFSPTLAGRIPRVGSEFHPVKLESVFRYPAVRYFWFACRPSWWTSYWPASQHGPGLEERYSVFFRQFAEKHRRNFRK